MGKRSKITLGHSIYNKKCKSNTLDKNELVLSTKEEIDKAYENISDVNKLVEMYTMIHKHRFLNQKIEIVLVSAAIAAVISFLFDFINNNSGRILSFIIILVLIIIALRLIVKDISIHNFNEYDLYILPYEKAVIESTLSNISPEWKAIIQCKMNETDPWEG